MIKRQISVGDGRIDQRAESHDRREDRDQDQRKIIEKSDKWFLFPDKFAGEAGVDDPGLFPAQLLLEKLAPSGRYDRIRQGLAVIDSFFAAFDQPAGQRTIVAPGHWFAQKFFSQPGIQDRHHGTFPIS